MSRLIGSDWYACAVFFFFSSRRRHTRCLSDWSSDVCSSDLGEVGAEATRAAAGMVAPQAESTGPGPLLRLGIASRARYGEWTEALAAESGIDVEYRTDGIVYVALTAADARVLAARARWQRAAGLRVERLAHTTRLG